MQESGILIPTLYLGTLISLPANMLGFGDLFHIMDFDILINLSYKLVLFHRYLWHYSAQEPS